MRVRVCEYANVTLCPGDSVTGSYVSAGFLLGLSVRLPFDVMVDAVSIRSVARFTLGFGSLGRRETASTNTVSSTDRAPPLPLLLRCCAYSNMQNISAMHSTAWHHKIH